MVNVEKDLATRFSEQNLIQSGVFIAGQKGAQINPQLMEDHVIIPYLDEDGEAYHVRPHKLGFKGIPIQIYQKMNLGKSIILAEGEFKAAAAMQMGINAVAVPGIGSFSETHFPAMLALFNSAKVRDICIIFDNEEKDNPKYPDRYKSNPAARYDVHYYAWLMAYLLAKDGFNSKIGWLPDSWRVNGKADIDGALAMGKGKDDLLSVIVNARTHKEFLDELPSDVKVIINRKKEKRYFRSYIKRDFGRYVAVRKSGKNEYDEEISNFTIKIISTHDTPDGIVRHVQFVATNGQRSHVFPMQSEDMVSDASFRKFCYNMGGFVWKGRTEDLAYIWQEEFLDDDGRHIYEPDHVGYIEKEKVWLFANVAIAADGTEIRPDESGIFWMEKKGIKPLQLDSGDSSAGMPNLALQDFDARLLRDKLAQSIGFSEACMCVGWACSVFFMTEAFQHAGCFPFLFLTGKKSSGKTYIGEWLMHIYGLETKGIQALDTTSVGLQRYLSYYSNLPVFMDEYRNVDRITNKNGMLRNAYNRQTAIKGIKSNFGIRNAGIRGTMIISGQEQPNDSALLSRCINVLITANNRDKENNPFDWFVTNKRKFSNIGLTILRKRTIMSETFVKKMFVLRDHLNTIIPDDRKSTNYAIVMAGYACVYGDNEAKQFVNAWQEEALKAHKEIESVEESVIFWAEVLTMYSLKKMPLLWGVQNDRYHICFNEIYHIWSEDYMRRHRDVSFSKTSLLNIIRNEPYYLGEYALFNLNGKRMRSVEIMLEKAPSEIKEMFNE